MSFLYVSIEAADPLSDDDDDDEFKPDDFDMDDDDELNEPDELDFEMRDFVADNDVDDVDAGNEDGFDVKALDDELKDVLELIY